MGIIPNSNNGVVSITLLNAHGSGFVDTVKVTAGTTIEDLFKEVTKGARPDQYQITVNREPAQRSYILKEGDRVTITPAKIEGA
jgi:sulfur carrier protein ThiS